MTIYIVLMFPCLLLSAFFSSSEAAFLSVQKLRIMHLLEKRTPGAERVARMVEQPGRLLPTLLLGNNLANTSFAALATTMAVSLLGEGRGVLAATVGATVILLILGETIPKTIAVRHAERIAFSTAWLLEWFERLLLPSVVILHWINRRMARFVGGDTRAAVTEGEIKTLISLGVKSGAVDETEANMLQDVFRFGDRRVREVMTPRTEIVWIEKSTPLREFLKVYAEHYHTRFPVYEQTLDNVVGILSAKDVLQNIASGRVSSEDPVTEIIYTPYFVPETKAMATLFAEMRRFGHQMAMVIDEFGGIAGLATLKQLIEEVVGSIGEEGSEADSEYEAISENAFQIDGGMNFDQANEELGLGIAKGDYQTIAGFVLDTLGHIPHQGERLSYKNLRLEITEMKGLKIETVTITIAPQRAKIESAEANPEGSKTTP